MSITSDIARLKDFLYRVYQGEVDNSIQEKVRPLLASLKSAQAIGQLQSALQDSGFSAQEAKVLSGDHRYYIRWKLIMPSWHPVFILKEEHIKFMEIGAAAVRTMFKVYDAPGLDKAENEVKRIKELLKVWTLLEQHMVREENVLFPVLERHGLEEATAEKWEDHQDIRAARKAALELLNVMHEYPFHELRLKLREVMVRLNKVTGNHFNREERDLFNISLNLLSKSEWIEIRRGFDEMGYTGLIPVPSPAPAAPVQLGIQDAGPGAISFKTGSMNPKEIEAMLNALPVDITFVDKDDRVRYFNMVPDRLFPRAKGVIGREVRRCHPKKSLYMVDRILQEFKSGAKDEADFWIQMKGRFVYIRYFAVRDEQGEYLGTLEVTQDVTKIRDLTGEKRLLDWDKHDKT